jgi:hypothetical protein
MVFQLCTKRAHRVSRAAWYLGASPLPLCRTRAGHSLRTHVAQPDVGGHIGCLLDVPILCRWALKAAWAKQVNRGWLS